MRIKIFLPCLLILFVVIAFFYSISIQNPTLVVNAPLDITVWPETSTLPGTGSILEQNTSFTLVKWPQSVSDNVTSSLKYAFNEGRSTPVQFAVSFLLNEINRTILMSNLTTAGDYSAVATSTFPNLNAGNYSLTIAVFIPSLQKYESNFTELITIP